jgi:hypothetical protein
MTEKIKTNETRNYKERFEFELTVGNNIICQRYFKIMNFNPASLRSYELTEAIRRSVATIDNDLKDKTQAYLEMYAPMVFNTEEEMHAFFTNPYNASRMTLGEGVVVRGNKETDFVFTDKDGVKPLGHKFDDGELTEMSPEAGKVEYKFAFKVDGKERCAVIWDGYYPKFVRDKIDISNKRGKFNPEEVGRLSFEQYLLYKMVQNRNDLVYGIIKNICDACSYPVEDNDCYTTDIDGFLEGWKESNRRDLLRIKPEVKDEAKVE